MSLLSKMKTVSEPGFKAWSAGTTHWQATALAGMAAWLALRLLTSLWAALSSTVRPLTEIEQKFALWPPFEPLASWLERALLAPWLRWDAHWYARIASQGYNAQDGTAQFHPLYPALVGLLARLSVNPRLGLMIVSAAATLLLLVLFAKLVHLDLQGPTARTAVLLLVFFPAAFVLHAPYSESLFLLMSVLCFYAARRQQWWLAGAAGALASLTRQQGLFLVLPLAWEMWEVCGRKPSVFFRPSTRWLALGLIPAGMAAWLLYRAAVLNDLQPDFSSLHALIYSVLISPSSVEVVPNSRFLWPWQALLLTGKKMAQSPDVDILTNMVFAILFLGLLGLAWRRLRTGELLYTLAVVLAAFSFQTGSTHPYMGLVRHLYLAFPVFLRAAPQFDQPWKRIAILIVGIPGMLFLLLLYVLEAWVP